MSMSGSNVVEWAVESVLQVLEDDKQWWKLRNRSGQAGYVPFNILDVVTIEEPDEPFHQVIYNFRHPSFTAIVFVQDTLRWIANYYTDIVIMPIS